MLVALTYISLGLTVVLMAWTLSKGRRRTRLRPVFDIARVLVQIGIAVAIPLITGVTTAVPLIVGASILGVGLGVLQGQNLLVELEERKIYVTRGVLAFAIWGSGLLVMQAAGLANRTGYLQLGQGVAWFSVGVTVGLVVGRQGRVDVLAKAATVGVAMLLMSVVLLQSWNQPTAVAQSSGLDGLVGRVCDQLGFVAYSTGGCRDPQGGGSVDSPQAYVSSLGRLTGSGEPAAVGEIGIYFTFPPGEFIHNVEFVRCGLTGQAIRNSRAAALALAQALDAVIIAQCAPAPAPDPGAPADPGAPSAPVEPVIVTENIDPNAIPETAVIEDSGGELFPEPEPEPGSGPAESGPAESGSAESDSESGSAEPESAAVAPASDGVIQPDTDPGSFTAPDQSTAQAAGEDELDRPDSETVSEEEAALAAAAGLLAAAAAGLIGAAEAADGIRVEQSPSASYEDTLTPRERRRRAQERSDTDAVVGLLGASGINLRDPTEQTAEAAEALRTREEDRREREATRDREPMSREERDDAFTGFADGIMDRLGGAPHSDEITGVSVGRDGQGVGWGLDTDGDGRTDLAQWDHDNDGTVDESVPVYVDEEGFVHPRGDKPVADAGSETDSTGDGFAVEPDVEADETAPQEAREATDEPLRDAAGTAQNLAVDAQEIEDIYSRGLANGRSLNDLQEDVAGLSQARGGTADFENPYALMDRDTSNGSVPLTPGEYSHYRKQTAELGSLETERQRLDRVWSGIQEKRGKWTRQELNTEMRSMSTAMEVWDAASKYQPDIDTTEAWIDTYEFWARGDTSWKAPDGSRGFELSDEEIASRLEARREVRSILSARLRNDIESIQQRVNSGQALDKLDELQDQFLRIRRELDARIDTSEQTVEMYESWASGGRPMPER